MTGTDFITLTRAGRILSRDPRTVASMIRRGELAAFEVAGRRVVKESDVRALLNPVPVATQRLSLSPSRAGKRLGMSTSTVTRRVHDGELAGYRVGRFIRIPEAEVERYADELMVQMVREDEAGIEDDPDR
ncbi:hypothetical protein TPB0596_09900 [Tsukamurella pulmonis]|uniref:helix-turn-helix domain-containing protein n=1 Tax=Tsukamurella pulmonis TaxID=47312 RepID=UPI001EDEE4F1|nr:helix-turn-helix domain-containing protein [Tsukamurella pulmonis]BDD81227.1 hypothetical protein TPB0596_09900 [Tsukamurella pulmonis]